MLQSIQSSHVCTHFGMCGGCQLQNLSYEEQLTKKEESVRQLFKAPVEKIAPCENFWNYRNKIEFSFSQSKKGEKFLGLWMKKGRVLSLDMCLLIPEWMVDVLHRVKAWWEKSPNAAYHPPTDTGCLRTLTLREGVRTGEKAVIFTISGRPEYALEKHELSTLQELLRDIHVIVVRKQILAKKTATRFEEVYLTIQDKIQEILFDEKGGKWMFNIRPSSFFQPNTSQAEKIYGTTLELAALKKEDVVFDLYSGTGTLSIFAASVAQQVFGIELCQEAVQDAQENIKLNKLESKVAILQGDVGKVLTKLYIQPTAIFLDPPRAGLSCEALDHVLSCGAPKIVYISCNPHTQFENCNVLISHGYTIKKIQPIDQFPHTPHIENIVLLQKAL